ncbi:hypothetical protein D3C84_1131220 [compost metagenome]
MQQRRIRGIAVFRDQYTGGIQGGALLRGGGCVTGVRKISTHRQRHRIGTDRQHRTPCARGKGHFFAGVQMLLAVNPKRSIGTEHQCANQYWRIV